MPGQVDELKRALNFLRLNNYRTYASVCASGVSSAARERLLSSLPSHRKTPRQCRASAMYWSQGVSRRDGLLIPQLAMRQHLKPVASPARLRRTCRKSDLVAIHEAAVRVKPSTEPKNRRLRDRHHIGSVGNGLQVSLRGGAPRKQGGGHETVHSLATGKANQRSRSRLIAAAANRRMGRLNHIRDAGRGDRIPLRDQR